MEPPKPFRDKRPWGDELWLVGNPPVATPSMVKILTVNPGETLSLQFHHKRDEFWHVISGNGKAIIGESEVPLVPESDHFVSREVKHRLIGGTEPLVIMEMAFGNFDEEDIVRLEDKYGRVSK